MQVTRAILILFTALTFSFHAKAEVPDPEDALEKIIDAFQRGGPPLAYQALSPLVFNIVANQTGGSGYYASIAAAGPVTSTEILDRSDLPNGPMYLIRVTHAGSGFVRGGPVDWFIGFNEDSGKIEYLTFQTVTPGNTPSLTVGAKESQNIGGVKPTKSAPAPAPSQETPEERAVRLACGNFPVMCK